MQKRNLLYEGKAKKTYATESPTYYIADYKDDTTTFNGLGKGAIAGKDVVNNRMSSFMFQVLEKDGVPTHLVEEPSDHETLVEEIEIVPLGVIVRSKAAGSLAKYPDLEEGTPMRTPVLKFCYKNDELGDPVVSGYHILATDFVAKEEIDVISKMTLRINGLICKFSRSVNIELIDLKLEFGCCNGKIILIDEIPPDTCHFRDIRTYEKPDKDRFRCDLGSVEGTYAEVMKRTGLQWLSMLVSRR